jgi:integrase
VCNKKLPITADILKKLCILYGNYSSNLLDIRICCMTLLGYAGFLRISELLNIRRSDLSFHDDYMSIFIEKSKTDRYR